MFTITGILTEHSEVVLQLYLPAKVLKGTVFY